MPLDQQDIVGRPQIVPGLPLAPAPELPPLDPADAIEAIQLEHPEHTEVKHVGGGAFTSKNSSGQVVITSADVAHKYANKHFA